MNAHSSSRRILVLNTGSSSIKFALYGVSEDSLESLLDGEIEDIGEQARWHISEVDQTKLSSAESQLSPFPSLAKDADHATSLSTLLTWLCTESALELDAVGHRIVHGGDQFLSPCFLDRETISSLETYIPLAPLHQPHNLRAVKILHDMAPSLKQVGVFDTAFHAHHKKPVNQFALPNAYYDEGVRRYGFHGISYDYICRKLRAERSPLAKKKIIIAHLGNGASLCAINKGQSIDSTMGFSALDGLMMGTRCGDIDPGVLLYFLDQKKMSPNEITQLLYKKSGLLGVSGLSFDMRDLLETESIAAKEALDLFVFRIVKEIGALSAVLGGLDGLVFTGGIGEHVSVIRSRVSRSLHWLGAELDETANEKNQQCISSAESRLKLEIHHTNESRLIAEETYAALTKNLEGGNHGLGRS